MDAHQEKSPDRHKAIQADIEEEVAPQDRAQLKFPENAKSKSERPANNDLVHEQNDPPGHAIIQ